MNLTQAEAITSLYSELIKSIDKSKIPIPVSHYHSDWTRDNIVDIYLNEEGGVVVKWSRYVGYGKYDTEETNLPLDMLFTDK